MIGKARLWIEAILRDQKEDGSFGPASNPDWWSRMIAIKALAQCFDATADNRILDFMERYFDHQRRELTGRPLTDWGRARGHENALTVFWLADRRANARLREARALLLVVGIPAETEGIGWLVVLALGHVLRTTIVKAKHFVIHVLP